MGACVGCRLASSVSSPTEIRTRHSPASGEGHQARHAALHLSAGRVAMAVAVVEGQRENRIVSRSIIGLIPGEPGSFGISFPDVPGWISSGATLDETLS